MGRWSGIALVLGSALFLGAASATSLGGFGAPVATGIAGDVEPCTYTGVTLLDTVGGDLATTISPLSFLAAIELTGVTGVCEDHVPVPVIEGFDLSLSGPEVLFVLDAEFAPLGAGDVGTVTLTLPTPIPMGDGLTGIYVITDTRVGFCPGGASCT